MSSSVVRIFAVCLVVLSVCPFTAPFLICDLSALDDGHMTAGAMLKTVTDTHKALAHLDVSSLHTAFATIAVPRVAHDDDRAATKRCDRVVLRL